MRFDRVGLETLASELPTTEVRTAAIEAELRPLYQRLGIPSGWLESITGIETRRVFRADESPTLAAARAAERALDEAAIAAREVDVVVSASVFRRHLEPSVACHVHRALGLRPGALNFDVGNACLGFLTAMGLVAQLIEGGQARVGVVVAGESSREVVGNTLARLNAEGVGMTELREHLATLTLGSGAVAAVLVDLGRARHGHRLLGGHSLAATEHAGLCAGGLDGMITDPARLLLEGVRLAERTWAEFAPAFGAHDSREYVLHQVGKANHDAVLKALSLPEARALRVYPTYGNVGAAGVPLTLALAAQQHRFGVGDAVSLMGIGSGLNVTMMQVAW